LSQCGASLQIELPFCPGADDKDAEPEKVEGSFSSMRAKENRRRLVQAGDRNQHRARAAQRLGDRVKSCVIGVIKNCALNSTSIVGFVLLASLFGGSGSGYCQPVPPASLDASALIEQIKVEIQEARKLKTRPTLTIKNVKVTLKAVAERSADGSVKLCRGHQR
jgi:hypothetical protein